MIMFNGSVYLYLINTQISAQKNVTNLNTNILKYYIVGHFGVHLGFPKKLYDRNSR